MAAVLVLVLLVAVLVVLVVGCDRKLDAERFLTTVESSKLSGAYVDPGRRQGRIQGVRRAVASGPSASVGDRIPNRVKPAVAHLSTHRVEAFGSIRRSEIQGLIKGLDGELAPATVVLIYRWVVSIFRSAVADRVIAETPCRAIKLPNVDKAKVVQLSVETVEALIGAVPARYRALIVLGAGTGIRISLGLTNDRINWMRGRSVTIDRQMLRDGGGRPLFGPVKDRKNRPRTIPLPDSGLGCLGQERPSLRSGLGRAALHQLERTAGPADDLQRHVACRGRAPRHPERR
ncbi:MAG TPA: hypothetical protein VHT75_12395 [Acidimicrobiales bacterium]|nr:hypothetical protein [Acidimicrobiales bacterium]